MKKWDQYKLRLERKRRRARALRKMRELECLAFKMGNLPKNAVISFTTLRNEFVRLPYFLDYYRKLGVSHFCIVDNGSDDGGRDYLLAQPDVSLWHTERSYKRSSFGVDWLNGLQSKHADGHWCLTVDVDEFFVYPHCDTRSLAALTNWLDASRIRSFGAMLVDTYPKGAVSESKYQAGQDPLDVAPYFDAGNYFFSRNFKYGNLWIQGGPRQRVFFKGRPAYAPALNKIPLVKWARGNVYISSTHNLLPRSLNLTFAHNGGQRASGVLMHTKFLHMFSDKAEEELKRNEHYARSREYRSYANHRGRNDNLWTEHSAKYEGWRQLQDIGLLSSGDWA